MGLDNRIYIRDRQTKELVCKEDIIDKEYSQAYFPMLLDTDICYWRKFWSFRNDVVFDILRDGNYHVELVFSDLYHIVNKLERYMDKEYYESKKNCGTIWDWRECLPIIVKTLTNLRLLIDDIQNERIDLSKYEIVWEDSY